MPWLNTTAVIVAFFSGMSAAFTGWALDIVYRRSARVFQKHGHDRGGQFILSFFREMRQADLFLMLLGAILMALALALALAPGGAVIYVLLIAGSLVVLTYSAVRIVEQQRKAYLIRDPGEE